MSDLQRWLCSECDDEQLTRSGVHHHAHSEHPDSGAQPVAYALVRLDALEGDAITSLVARVQLLEQWAKVSTRNDQLLLQCVDAITELVADDSA